MSNTVVERIAPVHTTGSSDTFAEMIRVLAGGAPTQPGWKRGTIYPVDSRESISSAAYHELEINSDRQVNSDVAAKRLARWFQKQLLKGVG